MAIRGFCHLKVNIYHSDLLLFVHVSFCNYISQIKELDWHKNSWEVPGSCKDLHPQWCSQRNTLIYTFCLSDSVRDFSKDSTPKWRRGNGHWCVKSQFEVVQSRIKLNFHEKKIYIYLKSKGFVFWNESCEFSNHHTDSELLNLTLFWVEASTSHTSSWEDNFIWKCFVFQKLQQSQLWLQLLPREVEPAPVEPGSSCIVCQLPQGGGFESLPGHSSCQREWKKFVCMSGSLCVYGRWGFSTNWAGWWCWGEFIQSLQIKLNQCNKSGDYKLQITVVQFDYIKQQWSVEKFLFKENLFWILYITYCDLQ